ncbi:G3P acyltransferase [Metamycoplasma arthritidis]|uniref:Glycerol-3-phosphate acyltransferase n=1 Tax=Metamycoplasma arthritidis (strain 158L3-1) TaxID=243272 RepID=B3PNI2_META1|nr:glycerol-3-phosphate 1-O-acyltransferase PlsY [Metamycoplasma arthritidis]ACF07584.1 conserved membrane protein [Metamycoplasma arthritidis 158L3-1]VEU79092.1 G3P acyltransferase [Metamycoplasma arthritidis]
MIGKYIYINLILLVIGYLIGSINVGIIYTKKINDDIRKKGSGNAGTTNILRNFGLKMALGVFVFDSFKSLLPIMIVFFVKQFSNLSNKEFILPLFIGLGAFLGHIFPIYFKFKGGKGVACFFGILFAFHILAFSLFLTIYLLIVLISRYVSLASALATFIISPVSMLYVLNRGTYLSYMQANVIYPAHAIVIIICAIVIILKHIPNYIRLVNKTESKIKL